MYYYLYHNVFELRGVFCILQYVAYIKDINLKIALIPDAYITI